MAVYTNHDGQTIQSSQEIGRGGEGAIYCVVGHSEVVAKIYHPPLRTESRHAKLMAMVARPPADRCRALSPPHTSLAWPTDLLFENDRFAGFLMPRIEDSPNLVALFNPMLRRQRFPQADRRFLYRAAQNLAAVLASLHSRGHVMGDLNQKNILVKSNALVTLVDTDSFQIGNGNNQTYRCAVGVPEYTPPELQGQSLATIDRQPYHDCFGLSVLIFQLLMEGYHPFTGRPLTQELSEVEQLSVHCMQQGWFPYSNNHAVQPPPAAPLFTCLPPEIRQLFLQSFLVGYSTPTERPTATTWARVLGRAELDLIQCRQEKAHWYSSHLQRCPYCLMVSTVTPKAASVTPVLNRPVTPSSVVASPTVPAINGGPGCATNLLKVIGAFVALGLFLSGNWILLMALIIAAGRAQQIRQHLWPTIIRVYGWLVSSSQLIGRGIRILYRLLAPHAKLLGHAIATHWMQMSTKVRTRVIVGLLIALIVAINYLGSGSSTAGQQPESPLIASPLAQPTQQADINVH